MSRRSPLLGLGLVWACLLALLLPVAARAEGKPNIGISATAPTSVLFGAKATIALEANNPAGEPYGYNLSYRAVLPEGVAYVPGSTKIGSGGAAPTPTAIANQPKAGETTLIWSNVGDLSPASHETLSFEVSPSQVTYPVASHFIVPAEAFVAEAPRYLPKFSSTGKPEGPGPKSYTGFAEGSAETTISALQITQAEGSPEGEILRGMHDHQTVYKVTVTNNNVNQTTNVNVDDWLPAGLEYLGCGGAGTDHTTDAPTNPGSKEEYPGSGPINVAALGGCTAPEIVETKETDPDGAGVDPTAVYTHLRWSAGTLGPGETRTYEFRAAVPLRENTTTWTGVKPTPASGEQGVNLDNNSGKETRDGQTLVTFAKTEGLYQGKTPVSAEEHMTRVAKDITTEKSADLSTLSDGQVTKWTILVHSSEYRYNTGVEVTDTLPNGLCPLSSANLTPSAECEPNKAPSSPYTTATEEESGSWKLLWDKATDPALETLKQNETTTITFYSKTRTHYQLKHNPAGPILSNDKVENTVVASATTNVVCGNDTDCSEKGAKPIDHERPLSEPVQDNSHATQSAEGPTIDKEVAESGTNCLGDTYTSAIPVYHPGDLICWRLQASFPQSLSTHGTQVTDFLPASVLFDEAFEEKGEKGQARGPGDTLPATTFDHSEVPAGPETGGALRWTLPESGIVGSGNQRFERVFATSATLPKGAPQGDLQGNLMKFASINSPGESFALRAEADFKLQFPQLSLEKQIVNVNGKAIAPATSATVKGTDVVEFALTVKNAGEVAAQNTEVRDLLPNGLTCAEIVSISNKGACTAERITWGETGLGEEAIGVPANGQTVLHFTAKVPTLIDPATTLEDKAGVREYHSATNTGGEYTYIPAENIDPLLSEKEANVPAANAQAQLVTEDVKLKKTHTSTVNEAGNSIAQATIGEGVVFEVSATIPAGTTLGGAAKLSDPGIPTARLTYEVGSVEALVNGSAAPGTFKLEEVGGSPVVTLPENYAAPTTEAVNVTMRFRTHVANFTQNNAGGSAAEKAIPNKGKLAWTNPLAGAQTREAGDEVPLVEPLITLAESNNAGGKPVHGGQLVEYTLKLKNAAGASTAFDSKVVDTVPTGITPLNAKGEPLKDGEATASGGIWSEAKRTITWELEKLEGNHEQPFVYSAAVDESPVAGASLKNTALATTAGLPSEGRTAANAPTAAIKKRYEAKTEASLEVEGATIAKESDSPTATIGHRITYTLVVTLPAHVLAFDETVIDPLPASLDFDEYVSAKCTSGCPPESEPVVRTYKPETPTPTSPTTVGWSLGNLTETSVPRKVTLIFRASVRPTNRTTKALVEATNKISNTATVYYNQSSKVPFEEGKIPAVGLFSSKSASKVLTTEVVEPKLTLVKEASVNGGPYSAGPPLTLTDGASVSYRLKVKNTGTAPAYGIVVTDKPPSALEAVTPTENAGYVTSNVAGEIAWKVPVPVAAGASVELGYSTKLVTVKTLKAGQAVDNNATIPAYFGVSEAERAEEHKEYLGKPIPYREYKGPSAEVKATVALPAISIEKTTGAAGFPPSANAEVGQAFAWRVVVKNTSTVPAKNVHITDKLPANWEYVKGASFSPGGAIEPAVGGSLASGQELTWATPIELAAGASTILTYQAKPTLEAESSPGSGAGNPNKNTASATVQDAAGNSEDAEGPFAAGPATAQAVLQVPALTVTKTPVKASIPAGSEDTYTIIIHNTGAGVAREVLAEDTLPAGMTYKAGSATASPKAGFSEKSASESKVVWAIESIAAGASVEITVPVLTEASLPSGTKLTNTVAVHATAAPVPVKAEGTITLTTSADLEAFKEVVSKGPYVPGEKLTYKIGATNKGPSVARAVKLTDELPSGETFKKASSANCKATGQLVTCEEAELALEAKVAFEIEVELASSAKGAIVNSVLVKSETPDPEEKNNKASTTITPEPQADLKLEKTALVTPVVLGETASFQLLVTNNGPSDAEGVQIVDHLPSGLVYKSASGAEASCKAGGAEGREVTCTLPKALVAEGAAAVVLVLETKALGTLLNKATVSSAAKDTEPLNNSSEASVLVVPAPALTKESNGAEATIGQRIEYTLTLTLPAHLTMYDHTVIDTLPDTLDFDEYASAQCTAGCTAETTPTIHTYKAAREVSGTTRIAWDLGDVPASEVARTITLTYFASVRSTRYVAGGEVKAGEAIENSASDYYDQTNKQSFNENTIPAPGSFDRAGSPQNTSTTVVEPRLTLVKEASVDGGEFKAAPFTIAAGDTVTYRLKVENTGTSPAYMADVSDTPPHGLAVIETVANPAATLTKAWSEAAPEIDWQITGPLAVGETVLLEYKAKLVVGGVKDGQQLTNTASVPSYFGVAEAERGEGKENYFKEKISYREYTGPSASLTATVALPVLEVTKTPAQPSVLAGEKDSYTVAVHNSGTSIAHEVLVVDTLPTGMTYEAKTATANPATGFSEESVAGNIVTWKIAAIGSEESVDITVSVGIEASVETGIKLTNKVAVHSVEAPTAVTAQGTIETTTSAELSATKDVVGSGKAVPGKPLTYEVTTTNHGPSRAREVKLVDHLPLGLSYKSSSPAGCSEKAASVVTCAAGDIEPGHTAAFQIEVELAPSLTSTVSNTVIAESPTPDPKSKVEATKEVTVSPEADLELKKTAPPSVTTGEELTWTLTAKNDGPSDANGVTVVDPLPPGASYLKSTPSQGSCTEAAGTLTCKLGPLAAAGSATIAVTAKVTAAPGSLTNTATVGGEETDPKPENNKASATTTVLEPPSIVKASDSPAATIGHRIAYTLTVTIPAQATTFNQTVIDTLPTTLDFDEYVSATCTSGCTTPETAIVAQAYKPDVLVGAPFTTSVAWYLGNLTAAPAARTVVLVYRASVRETHRESSPPEAVRAPAEIENGAALYYNQTNKGSFEEENIPSPASFDQKASPVSTSTKVVEPSLTLTKEASVNGAPFSAAPFAIEAADTVTYRLTVENTGSSPAYDAEVSDVLPSGLTVLGTVANPAAMETKAWSEADPEIAWQIAGPLQAGEKIMLEYSVKLNTALVKDGQKLTNTATVPSYYGVSEQERGEGKENYFKEKILYRKYEGPSAQLTATVALPVLEVTKTPLQPSVFAGDTDSYAIAVHNSGTSVANEVKVLDTLPAGMTYEAGKATANPPTGFSEESIVGNAVTWKIASIGVGESVDITVPVGIEASVETGSELKNEVAATSTEQTTPVEAEGPIKVTTRADVEAKKSVLGGAITAVPGAQLTYVVAARNDGGPSVARAVELTDKLPASVVFLSASAGCTESAGTVTCAAGNLNPGQEASFQIVASVLSSYSGSILNTVHAESTETPGHPATPDPDPTNNEAHAEVSTLPSADLELVKTALTPEVHLGQQADFSLVVTNKGPSDAQEAKLIDTLPAGLVYVSAGGASCEAAGQVVTCALGTLTAGSSVTVELTTQPVGLGTYTNTAVVSSTTPDPNMSNNSSEATVKVVPVPVVTPVTPPTAVTPPTSGVSPSTGSVARTKVTLRKLVSEHQVAPGGRLDYRLIVRNAGAQTAEGLKVCDNLPEQTTVLGRDGGHLAGARICFTLATLAAGHSHTFTLVLRADSDANAQIVNHATVTGRNFDPAHARASTPVQKASSAPARENHVTG
jgi:large repetitive protein